MRNAQTSPGITVKPGILLLEEYAALASAISSALKKFAPGHQTEVARSLKEVETLARQSAPELLIIDVDPPWPKLTQLLGKLRKDFPDMRVLVIGATIPKALIENRGSRRALQFLEKPFDVPELGAAVQALLGPWKDAHAPQLRGTLRSFGTIDALLLQCASGCTVVVEVKKNGGKSGELHFVDGNLFHVENGKRAGVAALEELLSWPHPELREKEKRSRAAAKRTIPMPWTEAVLDALDRLKEDEPVMEEPLTPPAAPPPSPKTGKKIVVVDDTDMLLIFVEDVLTTANDTLQITTAADGRTGVQEIERISPDLVLLDYSLPDFNGDEVCRRLLANKQTAHIPVLMMSGHIPEMRRTSAAFENVVATIEKPFLSDALVAMVQETLETAPELRRRKSAAAQKSEPPTSAPAPAEVEIIEVKPEPAPPPPVPRASPAEPPRSQRTAKISSAPVVEVAAPAPVAEPRQAVSQPIEQPPAPAMPEPVSQPVVPVPAEPVSPPVAPVPPRAIPRPPPAPIPAPPPPVPFEHPVPHVISVAPPPVQQIPRPGITANFPARAEAPSAAQASGIAAPVLTSGINDVILGMFLEVVSMQLTPALRMGTIRARPSSMTVSLHVSSPALRAALPPNGFQLGAIDLDRFGRIAAIRVIPTIQPFTPLETRNALQISGVAVVASNSHNRLQLTPGTSAPMRMHLLAPLEVAGVELSPTFQISQLVLKSRTHNVRVTLSQQAVGQDQTGTTCETAGVQLDGAARLSELTLNPVG